MCANKYRNLDASEILMILQKQWASTNDIKLLGGVGNNLAYKIKKEMQNDLLARNIYFPASSVPMEEVVKKFNININYLKKITNK